jgi:hypothetical protein
MSPTSQVDRQEANQAKSFHQGFSWQCKHIPSLLLLPTYNLQTKKPLSGLKIRIPGRYFREAAAADKLVPTKKVSVDHVSTTLLIPPVLTII